MCSCQRTPPVLFAQGCNPGKLFPVNCHASGLRAIARLRPARRDFRRGIPNTFGVVGVTGLEPVTLRLSSACSNQLSYRPVTEKSVSPGCGLKGKVEARGFEPLTYSLQSYRSTN